MTRHFAMTVSICVTTLAAMGAANAQMPAAWNGAYFGASAGSTFGTSPGDTSSFMASAFLGSNVRFGYYILGAEGDLGWMSNNHWSWESSVRARVGGLMNAGTLLYATGGVAFGRVRADGFTDGWSTKTGYTLGAGIESATALRGAKVRLEYRYTDLGSLPDNSHARFQSVMLGLSVPLAMSAAPRGRLAR
jgi:opacity protein-like surface antigen